LTFTTVSPAKADLKVSGQGSPQAFLINGGQTLYLALVNDPSKPDTKEGAGVWFTATTAPGDKFGGQFALFQLVDSQSYLTAIDQNTGAPGYLRNVNGGSGMNFDSQGKLPCGLLLMDGGKRQPFR